MWVTEPKFRVRFSTTHPVTKDRTMDEIKEIKENVHKTYTPVTETLKETTKELFLQFSSSEGQDAYMYFTYDTADYGAYTFRRNWARALKSKQRRKATNQLPTLPSNLVNLQLLRKERLYTKLKYSRSPAYDIVSGGAAALLAGFLGFLISEKFGFELVDSGDFYYALMYLVFLGFSLKPLTLLASQDLGFIALLSLRKPLEFSTDLIKLLINFITRR